MDVYGVYIKNLNLRVLNFLRDIEGEVFSFKKLNKYFSYSEIIDVLNHSIFKKNLMDNLIKLTLPEDFQNLIDKNSIDKLEKGEYSDCMALTSDEILLKYLLNGKENLRQIVFWLKTDESREKALGLKTVRKNKSAIQRILENFKDENLKIKYLNLVDGNNVAYIVCELKNEDMRIYYYEKYFNDLSNYDKKIIFSTFSADNKIKYLNRYWKLYTQEEKIDLLISLKNEDDILNIIKLLSDIEKVKLISKLRNNQKLISKVESTITYNQRLLKMIIKENLESVIDKLNINLLFAHSRDWQTIRIIRNLDDVSVILLIVATMKNFRNIEKIINHLQDLPNYDEIYDSLINRYARKYKLNVNHLFQIVKLSGLEILKNIRNENLQKLINFDEQSFIKIMGLFDLKKHEMDINTLNDIINIFLQRLFRLRKPNVINISSDIRLAIQNNEKQKVFNLIEKIADQYDISKILQKYNYTKDEFIQKLVSTNSLNENDTACLLEITNGYIVYCRNGFIKNYIAGCQRNFCELEMDTKSVQMFMIQNFPIDMIKKIIFNKNDITLKNGAQEEEVELVQHSTILETIIQFLRNPDKFNKMPEEVKKYMKIFNKLFEKGIGKNIPFSLDLPYNEIKMVLKPYLGVNQDIIRDTLLNLNIDAIKNGVLLNEKIYQSLSKILIKYKFFGFNENMLLEFSDVELSVYGNNIASLINYFPIIESVLEEKMNKGEIKNITLPALLDMADCFAMDSDKLATLFGKDNARLILADPGPNSSTCSKEKRIEKAQKYLKNMYQRTKVSVPPCDENLVLSNGKILNVVVGNVTDPMNLTYGERTGSCMRIGGHADSLFDFCLTNDHGFHIRFSNPTDDMFVSRVSGFRNGNTVFLNELRYSKDSRYSNADIKDCCILVAQLLIKRSQSSSTPIENVVIAPEYVIDEPSISLGVPNIKMGVGKFYTDVSADNSVILASSNSDNSLVPIRLGNFGVYKYQVQRGKIKMYEGVKGIQYLNRIELIDQLLSGKSIDKAVIKPKKNIAFCYCGEDWYVFVDTNGKISDYVMKNSNRKDIAINEKKECIVDLKNNLAHTVEDRNIPEVLGGR